MLKKLRALRTNENILIAVDVLLHSKSSFMSIFLMAFMMNVSLSESPTDFIVYCIIRYSLVAILSASLLPAFRKHALAAWRCSMIFSVLQIMAIILIPADWLGFPYVVAIFSALESTLYWRPKMLFDVKEVKDDRRVKYKSVNQICIEIAKIVMPIILGITITKSSYVRAANIILGISLVQLLLTMLFRPTANHHIAHAKISDVFAYIGKHKTLQKLLVLQFLRGLVFASGAYVVFATANLYRNTSSDMDLGIYTALSSVLAIGILAIYRHFSKNKRAQRLILYSLVPAIILFPLACYFVPNNAMLAIAFYVFMQVVVASIFDSTVTVIRLQDILSRHIREDDYRVVAEVIGEFALSLGRVISLSILLAITVFSTLEVQIIYVFLISFVSIPTVFISIPKGDYGAKVRK